MRTRELLIASLLVLAGSPVVAQTMASAAGAGSSEAMAVATVEERPELLPNTCRQPEYPASLRAARMEGRVMLQFVVDTTGRVEASSIRSVQASFSGFVDAAKRAVQSCRYRPARFNRSPVRVTVQFPVVFALARS